MALKLTQDKVSHLKEVDIHKVLADSNIPDEQKMIEHGATMNHSYIAFPFLGKNLKQMMNEKGTTFSKMEVI